MRTAADRNGASPYGCFWPFGEVVARRVEVRSVGRSELNLLSLSSLHFLGCCRGVLHSAPAPEAIPLGAIQVSHRAPIRLRRRSHYWQ